MAPGNDVDPPGVDGEGQPEGEEPETTEVDPPALCLLESPQKRARVNGDEEETLKAGAPEFVSVADLYGRIGTHPGAVSIEAIFLFCASEVRWATVTDQRNLSLLTGTLPFGAHVAGFVSAVGSVSVSRNGNEMLSFRLNDTRGNYVECRACGRHARNKHIEEKNEIVAYGTQAQAGLKGAPGLLWVYNESHIVLLRRRGVFSRGTRCIEFRAEP